MVTDALITGVTPSSLNRSRPGAFNGGGVVSPMEAALLARPLANGNRVRPFNISLRFIFLVFIRKLCNPSLPMSYRVRLLWPRRWLYAREALVRTGLGILRSSPCNPQYR